MTKPLSIGEMMNQAVEALARGDKNLGEQILAELPGTADERDAAARTWAAARDERDREDQRRRQAIEMMDAGEFSARTVNAALSPRETAAMRHAREYLLGRKLVLVIAGGVGTGKTTAATWIALDAGGSSPGFIRASTLERRGRYSKTLDSWIETRSMLVIDDLGAEVLDGKGVFRSLLDEVIDTFYSDKRRVVITTNLRRTREGADGEPQFIERYGDRVASRLSEVGVWSDVGARDLRRDQLEIANGGRR